MVLANDGIAEKFVDADEGVADDRRTDMTDVHFFGGVGAGVFDDDEGCMIGPLAAVVIRMIEKFLPDTLNERHVIIGKIQIAVAARCDGREQCTLEIELASHLSSQLSG